MARADGVRQFLFPKRNIEEKDGNWYELSEQGRRIGLVEFEGGWATRLEDPRDFDVRDPSQMLYHQYRVSADRPMIRDQESAEAIAVPPKTLFYELGCAEQLEQVRGEFGDELALIGDLTSATLAFLVLMRGMNRALLDLIENPRLVHTIMEKGSGMVVERGKFLIDEGYRILRLNDSVANMSVISPGHWREFIFPHMKDVVDELHRYESGARIYCHICGDVMPILEQLIETGLDCIGPLDPLGGVKAGEVRQEVGDRVALMGGVNTLSLLNLGPDEVRAEATQCIREAGSKGGFILGSGCVVPRETPLANLLALREAAANYRNFNHGDTETKAR
jgi:uroporphyrinogen-III decarboxylase